jgi:hypothetical protein
MKKRYAIVMAPNEEPRLIPVRSNPQLAVDLTDILGEYTLARIGQPTDDTMILCAIQSGGKRPNRMVVTEWGYTFQTRGRIVLFTERHDDKVNKVFRSGLNEQQKSEWLYRVNNWPYIHSDKTWSDIPRKEVAHA